MKVLSLFGLKFFKEEYSLNFRYVIFLNQLKPKLYFQKQLSGFDVVCLDEGLKPKVSVEPDMSFINTIISRLVSFFEGLRYEETNNAVIYYREGKAVFMLSKSALTPVVSKGITPKKIVLRDHMPECMLMVIDSMVDQILNYYKAHYNSVLMYYYNFKVV